MTIFELYKTAARLAEALRGTMHLADHGDHSMRVEPARLALAEWDALTWDDWTQPNSATTEDVVATYDVDTIG